MNDIELLGAYGPDAPELSEQGRRAARDRLVAEITAAATGTHPPRNRFGLALLGGGDGGRGNRFGLRWSPLLLSVTVVGLVLVTAIVATGAARDDPGTAGRPDQVGAGTGSASQASHPSVAPSAAPSGASGGGPSGAPGGPGGAPGRIRLVAATAPAFPYAIDGLGRPTFTGDPGRPVTAVYPAAEGSTVVLSPGTAKSDVPLRDERQLSVDGHAGRILVTPAGALGSIGSADLTWERQPGQWVRVCGSGRYGTEQAVLALAARVVERPQPLTFKVRVGSVPDGWQLGGFKDGGALMTYYDPATPGQDLSVLWTAKPDATPDAQVQGFQSAQAVSVEGRSAHLVKAERCWRLTMTLADGSGLLVMAPRTFDTDQVVAMAASVRVDR